MIRKFFILTSAVAYLTTGYAQVSEQNIASDTLQPVLVEAYQYGRPMVEVPAAVGHIETNTLIRASPASLLPAVNTIAGVRMEERSPGSYRLSIRGSTLRAPYGIRNVKVYWNDLPLTDPGGNTYLNLLDLSGISQIEVIKGTAGSLYGAGTGGAVLLKSTSGPPTHSWYEVTATGGSYGLQRYTGTAQIRSKNDFITAQFAHQQADGYRSQTAMNRNVFQLQASFNTEEKSCLTANVLYSDLFYETPGGLTAAQYHENPRQARPATTTTPGAVEQQTAIYNHTLYTGITHHYQWNNKWSNRTGIYSAITRFENPFISNYEKRVETGLGGRFTTRYHFSKGSLNFGVEYQHGFSDINVYDNDGGTTGALQNSNEISSTTGLAFTQAEFSLPHEYFITLGASVNFFQVHYEQLSDVPPYKRQKTFNPVLLPRLAILKKLKPSFSLYTSIAQGFSPPTVAELFPSTAVFNNSLAPEKGTNLELGGKSNWLNHHLKANVTTYLFLLDETIVIRRDTDGNDYYVNAGKTKQQGIEAEISWAPICPPGTFCSSLKIWTSTTLNNYRFTKYIKDTDDYSHNKLTGVPPVVLVAGIDLSLRMDIYTNITYTYTDKIPLDDANSTYANAYQLLNIRLGYRHTITSRFPLDIFGGVNNALDEQYSLGNDLNAYGGRYYNAAPPINFYAGIRATFNPKKPGI